MSVISLAQLWTRHGPIRRGKDRIAAWALAHGRPPAEVLATSVDGRQLYVPPASETYRDVYFKGVYEECLTAFASLLIRPGDTVIDVGANIGWYTTLFGRLVGPTGMVHAFEPDPHTYAVAERNIAVNSLAPRIRLNPVALGSTNGTATLHAFSALPIGHASLSDFGRTDATTHQCTVTTLDGYVGEQQVGPVAFIKLDIEGAELDCLRGAQRVLSQQPPPMWLVEMAAATSRPFGHAPNDLLATMRRGADYDFFAVDEARWTLTPLDTFAAGSIGANVFCLPRTTAPDRMQALERFIQR